MNEILDEIIVITNESVEGKETTFSFDGTGFSASNKENYADKRQKQNSKKDRKKSKSVSKEQMDDSFPKSNSTAKMGFSYSVMGIGIQYKLILGISISPDYSIGENTMFPDAFGQILSYHPHRKMFLEMVFMDADGLSIWFRQITSRHTFYPAVM